MFEFDIQDLEESLLLHGAEDNDEDLVLQLVISLLQGCLPSFKKRINKEVGTSLRKDISNFTQFNHLFSEFQQIFATIFTNQTRRI